MKVLEAPTPPELGASVTGSNDNLAQVLCSEKPGRVGELRFGAAPTNTFGSSASKTIPQWQQEVTNLKQNVNSLESEVGTCEM